MNHTIRHAIVLTQHMTQAVRVKRRIADMEKQRQLQGLDRLKSALEGLVGGSGGFKRVPLIPEPPNENERVEAVIPVDDIPDDFLAMLKKLSQGGIEGASVKISELNPDGSVKRQKIIGDPEAFGEDDGGDLPRH